MASLLADQTKPTTSPTAGPFAYEALALNEAFLDHTAEANQFRDFDRVEQGHQINQTSFRPRRRLRLRGERDRE